MPPTIVRTLRTVFLFVTSPVVYLGIASGVFGYPAALAGEGPYFGSGFGLGHQMDQMAPVTPWTARGITRGTVREKVRDTIQVTQVEDATDALPQLPRGENWEILQLDDVPSLRVGGNLTKWSPSNGVFHQSLDGRVFSGRFHASSFGSGVGINLEGRLPLAYFAGETTTLDSTAEPEVGYPNRALARTRERGIASAITLRIAHIPELGFLVVSGPILVTSGFRFGAEANRTGERQTFGDENNLETQVSVPRLAAVLTRSEIGYQVGFKHEGIRISVEAAVGFAHMELKPPEPGTGNIAFRDSAVAPTFGMAFDISGPLGEQLRFGLAGAYHQTAELVFDHKGIDPRGRSLLAFRANGVEFRASIEVELP